MSGELIKVGKYDLKYNKILDIDIAELDIYRSTGLPAHMVKRKHFNCLKYIDDIPDILENPDYVGVNPKGQVHRVCKKVFKECFTWREVRKRGAISIYFNNV